MSMFTPVGMGGHVPMDRKKRLRRRLVRIAVVVLAVILLVLLAWRLLFTGDSDDETRAVACASPSASPSPPALRPADLLVNVYNATKREGLAAAVSTSLKRYGFQVGVVANDPLKKAVPGTAEVRGSAASAERMALLRRYVTGSVLLTDTRTKTDVDLVLGDAFQTLTVPSPAPAPSPNPSPSPDKQPPGC